MPASGRHPDEDGRHPGDLDCAAFYYDLSSPDAYLAAERVVGVLGTVPEFVPVRIAGAGAFRCAQEEEIYRSDIEQRAAAYGLLPVHWPPELPADTEWAMLVATYAKQTGRVVAYSMAAFRQAFAAGRDLGERDWVLVAAAAAEMHPAAVIKSAELRGTRRRLDEATAAARAAGVLDVPAVRVGDRVFHGDRELDAAARALGAVA
ncbi:MAG TPA: DsbA family protein [Solirubrobacteraceae bacterium]|nr:DsbA family protein [Solirubrobacteraceae bacterium]